MYMLLQNPDLTMKVKKLQKIVIKMVKESGVTQDEAQLRGMLMNKVNFRKNLPFPFFHSYILDNSLLFHLFLLQINSSSRFVVDNKKIQLVIKAKDC